jgi:plastocyanin
MSKTATLSVAALAASVLIACGGDDGGTSDDTDPTTYGLDVSAPEDGSLEFEPETLEAQPGSVVATFTNPAPIAHDFCVEDDGGEEIGCTRIVADGDDSTTTLELEQGDYTFYCSVAGHREGGMEGSLTVD